MRRNDTQTMGSRRIGRGSQSGFSLVELLVTLTILVLILVAVLAAFDLNTKIARAQIHVSDMQQSLRVAQNQLIKTVRMTGRGGMPIGVLPDGLGVAIDNKIAANTELVTGEPLTEIVSDTDVLTVRGVFSGALHQANPATSLTLNVACGAGAAADSGQVVLNDPSPSGVGQDFNPLTNLADNDALLLMSPIDSSIYAIVEIEIVTIVGNQVTICFQFQNGDYTTEYLALSPGGGFPAALTTVSYVGVLEEYRYYIRKVHAVAGDDASDLTPTLAVAQFYPGTQIAYDTDNTNLYVDLADNIMDLQLTLGVDLDNDGVVTENAPGARDTDEWLFNDAGDDPDPTLWVGNLFYVRVNGLARTDRRDLDFISAPITAIEDRDYSEPAVPGTEAARLERGFRRWQLQTLVDLRNVS